jgi:GTP-binding protein
VSGFVDEAQLHVKAGNGGAGAVSFRREAHVSRGGPDGGNGGRGGDVWLVATTDVASLLAFRDHPHRRASDGTHGGGKKRHGRAGADITVGVPQGTLVRSLSGDTVADLATVGERWLAARGGQGGRGNARFLSNRRRAPSFAEQGEVGEERWFDLELKLMADVALVGLPNAGKSTLISRISAARPKIADYPFTTLEPHLGVVRIGRSSEEANMVVADVPGLVAGASAGKGLGHRFLRHVERARVLVVLVDLAPMDGISADEQERILLEELGRYRPELLDRPRLKVGSKVDLVGVEGEGPPVDGTSGAGWEPDLRISAVTGAGLGPFVARLGALVQEARAICAPVESVVVHRPEPEGVDVERSDDGGFVVRGRPAERAVALSDLTDPQAIDYVQHRLHRLGVDRALARAGVREGDVVHVGAFSFTYEPDR